ncbi:hypothetical protein N7532_004242 [Penicillium argentinense]|uniref:Uncharacterized protein n=1 Tax=Penicillium argentinense TaxID=1131581 RepID=A0A9W9FP46_9EURO|nr:uncharacterized protein N7532_004242 [Penicillium argentinense]KAJ5103713.1 hypothetical protein N7532_004242 [Penicillium argentinense]
MSKRKAPGDRLFERGYRGANPQLFKSQPSPEWENRGLLNKTADLHDSNRFFYELPVPQSILAESKGVPTVYYGDNAPLPRWRLVLDPTDPTDQDQQKDNIRTLEGKTIIDGVTQDGHPRSFDPSIGLGGLQWEFDELPLSQNAPAEGASMLHAVAHRCLAEAMLNPIARQQMSREIANGPLWPKVCNVADPLPAPPPEPQPNLLPPIPKVDKGRYLHPNYQRDSLNVRAKGSGQAPGTEPSLADRLFFHQKGTQGPLHQADPLKSLEVTNSREEGPQTKKRKKGKSPGELEAQKESRTAKIGEYKCVWFCVILLVMSMFLCLFLYSFGVIKVV